MPLFTHAQAHVMDFITRIFPNFDNFLLVFGPAAFGIVCHEVAHGYAAYRLGDPTAKSLGRLTLNPLKHIDPMGTVMFLLTALMGPFVFGWAKPVPFQPRFFRNPRNGIVLVAIAGPLANFAVALLCAFIYVGTAVFATKYMPNSNSTSLLFIVKSAEAGIFINCALAWFNLMPIPPLDGSHVISRFLPRALAHQYEQLARYGFLILLFLLYFRVLTPIILPLIRTSYSIILAIPAFVFGITV